MTTACSEELRTDDLLTTGPVMTRAIESDASLRYNINEDPAKSLPTFNRENWRQHNTIYLCYSNTAEADRTITDSEGRTGYRAEILPWAKNASPMSNLPNNFCNDVTPENGWELVANFCGDFYHPNAHFFVLYNKYMGKLRYFYFIPRDGKPIVYSRNYLPEYKEMPIAQMPEVTDSYIRQNMPANYVPELYAQQMAHVRDIRNWTRRTLIPTGGTPCHLKAKRKCSKGADTWYVDDNECYVSEKESFAALFDNDLSNRWVAAWNNVYFVYDRWLLDDDVFCSGRAVCDGVWKNQPCWWVEFKSHLPISPRSYTLISANDAGTYPQCNPQCWILYGKKNEKDPWTMLGMSSYNNQPEDMLPRANSQPTRELPFRFNKCEDMQYFRFEIQNTDKTNSLQRLGEIRFNYDD